MKYIVIVLSVSLMAFTRQETAHYSKPTVTTEQREALVILTDKCNKCHQKQNPSKVFTLKNMDGFATKINRQVFVWKRMPKGNTKLSAQERQTLKKWLTTVNKTA